MVTALPREGNRGMGPGGIKRRVHPKCFYVLSGMMRSQGFIIVYTFWYASNVTEALESQLHQGYKLFECSNTCSVWTINRTGGKEVNNSLHSQVPKSKQLLLLLPQFSSGTSPCSMPPTTLYTQPTHPSQPTSKCSTPTRASMTSHDASSPHLGTVQPGSLRSALESFLKLCDLPVWETPQYLPQSSCSLSSSFNKN